MRHTDISQQHKLLDQVVALPALVQVNALRQHCLRVQVEAELLLVQTQRSVAETRLSGLFHSIIQIRVRLDIRFKVDIFYSNREEISDRYFLVSYIS